jgi:hypothetical protein
VSVGIGEHRHRLDAKLAAGPDDAHGNLPAIGDQNAPEFTCRDEMTRGTRLVSRVSRT